MTRERLGQIRQAVDHNPRGADGYVYELVRACEKLLGEVDVVRIERDRALESLDRAKARGDFAIEVRRDLVDVIQRVAESLEVSAEALIEDPSVAIRSARGNVRELREIAERNAANAQHLRATAIEAERERDEARAELDEAIEETNRVRVLLNATDDVRESARKYKLEMEVKHLDLIDALMAKNKVELERDTARAEVEMLRGVGCGELREGAEVADGPCGACLKCARRERDAATEELIAASREIEQLKAERDEARAEAAEALKLGERIAWIAAKTITKAAIDAAAFEASNQASRHFALANAAEDEERREQEDTAGREWSRLNQAYAQVWQRIWREQLAHEEAHEHLQSSSVVVPFPRMGQDQIVAARLSEQLKEARASREAMFAEVEQLREVLKTAGDRLRACAHQLTEHAYQEMASAIFDLPSSATIEQLRAEFPEVMP